jgi:hypothetical protein
VRILVPYIINIKGDNCNDGVDIGAAPATTMTLFTGRWEAAGTNMKKVQFVSCTKEAGAVNSCATVKTQIKRSVDFV